MKAKRIIHLGVDYGTSTSKLIFRDPQAPGGTRVAPIWHKNRFRIPSTVVVESGTLRFGHERGALQPRPDRRWLESLKMRVPGEVEGRAYKRGEALPEGFSASDLVTLTLYWLVSLAEGAVLSHLKWEPKDRGSLGLTLALGIPTSFYESRRLHQHFADLGSRAAMLRRERGPLGGESLSFDAARALLEQAAALVPKGSGPLQDVYPESQAGLWWAFKSPTISEGRFAEVDVGAGTTNASVFSLYDAGQDARKERLHVFGAAAVHQGMDDVDRALAGWEGTPDEWSKMRGQEGKLLESEAAARACHVPMASIYAGFGLAWKRGAKKNGAYPLELKYWLKGNFNLILSGGGSLVRAVRRQLARLPGQGSRLEKIVEPQLPAELMGSRGGLPREMVSFALVAYGLSDPDLEFQQLQLPAEMPDNPEPSPPARMANYRTCPTCQGQGGDCPRCSGRGQLWPETA
jgi:hypothetical protein